MAAGGDELTPVLVRKSPAERETAGVHLFSCPCILLLIEVESALSSRTREQDGNSWAIF
jgi:hypothetical protein